MMRYTCMIMVGYKKALFRRRSIRCWTAAVGQEESRYKFSLCWLDSPWSAYFETSESSDLPRNNAYFVSSWPYGHELIFFFFHLCSKVSLCQSGHAVTLGCYVVVERYWRAPYYALFTLCSTKTHYVVVSSAGEECMAWNYFLPHYKYLLIYRVAPPTWPL